MKTSLQSLFFLTFCLLLCKASHLPNLTELEQTEVEKLIKTEKDYKVKFGILKEASIQTAELLKEATLKTELLKKASVQTAELLKDAEEKIEAGIEQVNMAPQVLIDVKSKEKSGKPRSVARGPARCGDWKPYKDEKCLKIATRAGHKTKEDAELACQAFSEETNKELYPRLMAIKTKEEQEFIQQFLFDENKLVENVWLGLQKVGTTEDFEWSDGASVEYSNWANQTAAGDKHHCVQMASGQEIVASGLWLRVTCMKYNIVICEKTQIWTIENMQSNFMNYRLEQQRLFLNQERIFLNYKQEQDRRNEELEKERERMFLNYKQAQDRRNEELEKERERMFLNYKLEQDRKNEALQNETDNLKRNPVPLGFIYVQLATQELPSTLWPQTKWTDVSASYAGLFFRVVGGNAAPFGQIQEGNSSRLEEVYIVSNRTNNNPLKIPSDGSWSQYIWTGASSGTTYYQRFRLSGAEFRPRNQAMKIWKRIQ